ncbi:MAG: DUF1501 domain-containing protein [Burkholderiaceae bacterium]
MSNATPNPARRRLLRSALGVAALAPLATLSLSASLNAGAIERRFVFVILRGGLDALSAVPAIGDPAFAAARGSLAPAPGSALPLDGLFALHPSLVQLHAMYGRGELAVVHAVGLPYRNRSHFDGQQVLESGSARPYELTTGWLGRAQSRSASASIALATAVPLVLRGPGNVDTWAPSVLPEPGADLVARLARMYADDPMLAVALERARALHFDGAMPGAAMADGVTAGGMAGGGGGYGGFVVLAKRAAEFLARPGGPQVAVLELGGWDTHANQANPNGPLARNLQQLDNGLAALREGLLADGVWGRTVVVVATEFGREVAVNGTLGTDHGSGGAAFVLGGPVHGARVVADWPGLATRDRFEGRDLKTTTDLRGVLKGVLGEHLQIDSKRLAGEIFPGSEAVPALFVLRG